jgi:hypothetical protein
MDVLAVAYIVFVNREIPGDSLDAAASLLGSRGRISLGVSCVYISLVLSIDIFLSLVIAL